MLEQVRIQNFKSLKDVTLDLQKVNLLIGPNNSGKSNFLKALEFCSYIFDSLINSGEFNDFTFKHNKSTNDNTYFDLSSFGFHFHIKIRKENNRFFFERLFENEIYGVLELSQKSTDLNRNFKKFNELNRAFFYQTRIYHPNPLELLKPFPILPNQENVNSDASNLIAFFDNIRDKYRDSFEAIENDLNRCIPEFSRIDFKNITPSDELKNQYGDRTFKRLGLYNKEQKQTYWADELSEGVLYLLALLCIVHQPNPPKLLLLEEPEKGIHPRRIREVMNFIFQLAEQKDIQVILTSHSEHVLEDFATMPESVFIFDKDEDGATFVKNLKNDIIEPSHKRSDELGVERIDFTSNIGENWFMGLMGGVPV